MYIQITERCNMTCAHCMFACTSRGRDMNLRTFCKSLDRAAEYGGCVTLGGGEPTIHPQFWDFLGRALGHANIESVFLVTNGSVTYTAMALAAMARNGVLGCALSQDDYHDPIDSKVVNAFARDNPRMLAFRWRERLDESVMDLREIRTVTQLVNSGRCDFGTTDDCCADGSVFVLPSGQVKQCACKDSPIVGNVHAGFKPLGPHEEPWTCYRKLEPAHASG